MVRLPGYGARRPGQLSGGQRQRVALARALVNRPKVLLLDEPLGALDLKLREKMQEELKALQKALGITFVFVTHDQGEALSMADRVAVFNDGRICRSARRRRSTSGRARASSPISSARPTSCRPISCSAIPASSAGAACAPSRSASARRQRRRRARPRRLAQLSRRRDAPCRSTPTGSAPACAAACRAARCPPIGEPVVLTFNRDHLHLMEDEA